MKNYLQAIRKQLFFAIHDDVSGVACEFSQENSRDTSCISRGRRAHTRHYLDVRRASQVRRGVTPERREDSKPSRPTSAMAEIFDDDDSQGEGTCRRLPQDEVTRDGIKEH